MKSQSFKILVLVLGIFISSTLFANTELDSLLKKVMSERSEESSLWKSRETEFLQNKNKQAQVLAAAKEELRKLEAIGNSLNKTYEAQDKKLKELNENKENVMGAFGELYGVVRQMATDFLAQVENSPTSAQQPDRLKLLRALSQSPDLPDFNQLENLWYAFHEEITLQSQTPTFKTVVTSVDGHSAEREVTRLGAFSLFTGRDFLSFQPATNKLEEYPKQPGWSYTRTLPKFAKAREGSIANVSFDPSKGALLETLVQVPTFFERFQHGGLIGYVITTLMLIGFGVTAERILFYRKQEKLMQKQLQNWNNPDPSNPLGALIATFNKYKYSDPEVIELKLTEVILHVKPSFQRGISTIKTFAGLGPLIGLLGTVTGMIMTFQAITIFGTGDPKLMAGGISHALVATSQGLICAIPLMIAYSYVNGKYNRAMIFLNEQLAGLLAEKVRQPEFTSPTESHAKKIAEIDFIEETTDKGL